MIIRDSSVNSWHLPAKATGHAGTIEVTGEELRELLGTTLDPTMLGELAETYGVQQRERKLNVTELLIALILTGGTHEGGRQYDVLRAYLKNTSTKVQRSAFYAWFTEPLERVLTVLLARALDAGQRQPKLLPGILAGVSDWRIVDATTVRLRDELVDTYPGAGDYAALKVHKEWSVGTGNLCAYKITPARDHDSPHLMVDESRRGTGLIADLAYVSLVRLRDCDAHARSLRGPRGPREGRLEADRRPPRAGHGLPQNGKRTGLRFASRGRRHHP